MKNKTLFIFIVGFLLLWALGLAFAQGTGRLASHAIWGVTVTGDGANAYTSKIPRTWINPTANTAAYTIHVALQTYVVERCSYGGGFYTLIRERQRYRVRIIDNAQNTTIVERDFLGPAPGRCENIERFFGSTLYRTGGLPNDPAEFERWIKGYERRLTPPDPTATPTNYPQLPLADGAIFGTWLEKGDTLPQSQFSLYRGVFPPEWLARTEAEAFYVLTFSLDRQKGNNCTYGRTSVGTERYRLRVEVRRKDNNALARETTLYGAYPTCPANNPNRTVLLGELPHPAQFARWVGQSTQLAPPTPTRTPTLSPTPTLTPTLTKTPTPTLSPTPLVIPDDAPVVTVRSDSINLRAAPSTSAAVLGVARRGTSLTVLGRNAAGDWLQVVTEDQRLAWAFADLLNLGDLDVMSVPEAQF